MAQAVEESLPYLELSLNAQVPSFGYLESALQDSRRTPCALLKAVAMEVAAYNSSSEAVGVASF